MSQLIRCDHCGTPIAEVKDDGTVVILARHHGEKHVSQFKVAQK